MKPKVRLLSNDDEESSYKFRFPRYAYFDEPMSDESDAARVEFWLFDEEDDEPMVPHLELYDDDEASGYRQLLFRNWEAA